MAYNPNLMPRNLEEWNQLVDFYFAQENTDPAEQVTRQEIEARFACYRPGTPAPVAPAPTFAELKAEKLGELKAAFAAALAHARVETPDGWPADANDTAYIRVQGLLITMENSDGGEVDFCDADNNFHPVSRQELEQIQHLIINNTNALCQKKWALRAQISEAESEAELAAITVSFQPGAAS